MNDVGPDLEILAPRELKPKFDYLHRGVQRAAGRRMTRREALGLGGMAIFAAATAAACGNKNSNGGAAGNHPSNTNTLAGKPLEGQLIMYNWSEYDDPSTF